MATIYRYVNNSPSGSCDNCDAWDGVEGTEEELAEAPNPDCRHPDSCSCTWEEVGDDGDDCEDEGLLSCVDSEGFEFCGEEGDDGCGEDGCWCETGIDEDGNEIECREGVYWDPLCVCHQLCSDGDDGL